MKPRCLKNITSISVELIIINKKDKSCTSYRLRNIFQYEEHSMTVELSEFLYVEIFTDDAFIRCLYVHKELKICLKSFKITSLLKFLSTNDG